MEQMYADYVDNYLHSQLLIKKRLKYFKYPVSFALQAILRSHKKEIQGIHSVIS